MRAILILVALLPSPAFALVMCDDLWFTRNLVYHRAGYCFSGALGQAVFGNEGCRDEAVVLASADRALVVRLRALEAEWECRLRKGHDALDLPQIALRKRMTDLPVATGTESTCIGWQGPRLPLRTARDDIAPLTGAARPGDTLSFQFEDVDGWSFVEVDQNGVAAGAGWAKIEISETTCRVVAG